MTCRICTWPRTLLAVALALTIGVGVATAADVGGRIERFSLPDSFARDRSLDEFKDSKVVVVAFLGAECPLARLYGPRLQELANEYGPKGVAFVGIDANSQDSLADIANYAKMYNVTFPLLKDRDGSVADQFGTVRNPEVFVLDKDRVIRYRGRVDDQYGIGSSAGYTKTELKDRNLGNAIDELLAGKVVSNPKSEVTGCIIGRAAKVAPKGEITYTKHIAAIIERRCEECHREGQVAPFALTDYESTAGWAQMMKEVVNEGRMPPWSANPEFGHFNNDPRLSAEEKSTLFAWIDNGCPQGDAKDLPPKRQWADGWRIPKPDQIVSMTKSFHVPAEGVINYQSFSVDPGWTEDKWIQMAEVQPGAFGNVHHIIVSISPPRAAGAAGLGPARFEDAAATDGAAEPADAPRRNRQAGARGGRPGADRTAQADQRGEEALDEGAEPVAAPRGRGGRARSTEGLDAAALRGGRISAFIPGRNPTVCPPGTAIFAAAGSRITFQMHYTANGKETDDISRVGLVFCDPSTVKNLSYTSGCSAGDFEIPPYAPNHKVEAEVTFANDTSLIVLHPHMHLRGKSMRYEAIYPDGTREALLDVPHYDPSWQFEYELATPKPMPAGTKMHVTAHFDNSVDNPSNPDPSKAITWGPQTWDEMMIGFYTTITPLERALAAKAEMEKKAAAEKAGAGGQ